MFLIIFYIYIIFLGKINILKTTLDFDYLIKGTVLKQALWGVNTFPTCNRLPNSFLFRRLIPYSFLGFSIVFHKKIWCNSIFFLFISFYLDRHTRRDFRSWQLATPLGNIIWESSHLIKWSNLNVVFNICFSLFLIVFVYCILIGLWILICYYMIWTDWLKEILNPRVEYMLMIAISVISAWKFSGCFAGEGLGAYRFYSLHTHTFMYISWVGS